jgi:Mg/Co/Ni transporter MgtE
VSSGAHEELLARLARLDSADRAWLLGELPPALRRELASALSGDDAPAAGGAPPEPAIPAGWESLPVEHVADALEHEPVWLVSAATRVAEARWRERLLLAMSTRRRQEIQYADRAGRPLAARAARAVLAGVRARIEGGQTRAAAPRSKFAALVEQMRSRLA